VADECDLTLLGYIAFLDPPKDTAREAIAALAEKGVQVKILTGDNEIITRKICREVKIDPGVVLLGSQVERLDDAKLAEIADHTTVVSHDIYASVLSTGKVSEDKEVRLSKLAAIAIGIIAIVLGYIFEKQSVAFMLVLPSPSRRAATSRCC
jgi:hypothetical protein